MERGLRLLQFHERMKNFSGVMVVWEVMLRVR